MDFERLTWPSPLLEPPLPFGSGGSTAADTASCVAVRLELVITFPPAVCALRPGEPFWPGSPCPFGDPLWAWSDDTELPHLGVDLDQRLLPLPDLSELVAPKRPVAGVVMAQTVQ